VFNKADPPQLALGISCLAAYNDTDKVEKVMEVPQPQPSRLRHKHHLLEKRFIADGVVSTG
jgi:hypothetical protein